MSVLLGKKGQKITIKSVNTETFLKLAIVIVYADTGILGENALLFSELTVFKLYGTENKPRQNHILLANWVTLPVKTQFIRHSHIGKTGFLTYLKFMVVMMQRKRQK